MLIFFHYKVFSKKKLLFLYFLLGIAIYRLQVTTFFNASVSGNTICIQRVLSFNYPSDTNYNCWSTHITKNHWKI
jgi:hypothetical protein